MIAGEAYDGSSALSWKATHEADDSDLPSGTRSVRYSHLGYEEVDGARLCLLRSLSRAVARTEPSPRPCEC